MADAKQRRGGEARSSLQAGLVGLYAKFGGDRLRRTAWGGRLFDLAYLSYKLAVEAGPIAALSRYLAPGSWAIDVGANIGVFTLRFARYCNVAAIEPEERNFASLERRIAGAGAANRIVALRAVADTEAGERFLRVNPDHPGDHRLASTGAPVEAVTIDGLVAGRGLGPVSLIKIDVQGAELKVLRGADAVLTRDAPALFIEIDDEALRQQGASAGEVLDFLAARGYRPHRLRRRGAPVGLSRAEIENSPGYLDVLFLSVTRRPAGV